MKYCTLLFLSIYSAKYDPLTDVYSIHKIKKLCGRACTQHGNTCRTEVGYTLEYRTYGYMASGVQNTFGFSQFGDIVFDQLLEYLDSLLHRQRRR